MDDKSDIEQIIEIRDEAENRDSSLEDGQVTDRDGQGATLDGEKLG